MYLGASHCTFFLAYDIFILMSLFFLWVVYDRGRHYVLTSISCFTLCYIGYWFIFMRLFMIYVFYFMLCEIKNLFCFTCIFHTCVYVFVKVIHEYISWFSRAAIYTCNWYIVVRLNCFWLDNYIVVGCFCNFKHFVLLCVLLRISKKGVC